MIAAALSGLIGAPLVILGATLGLAWETIWVDKIYQLVAPSYNWPTITYTGWFAINGIVSILCRGPVPKKTHKLNWLYGMATPVLAWLAMHVVLWWLA